MAITVQTSAGGQVTHDLGSKVMVKEGHLYVLSSLGRDKETVAVYAPEQWRSAVVETH